MAESAAGSTAVWLGKVLAEEVYYLGSVRGKVEKLKTELGLLAVFIEIAVKNDPRRQDKLVQTVTYEARNVAYDCEDVIDTYILKLSRNGYEDYEGFNWKNSVRWILMLGKAYVVHIIGAHIDDLNQRILSLKQSLASYVVVSRNSDSAVNNQSDGDPRRDNFLHARKREEEVVVGFKEQVRELVGILMNVADRRVIALCGMGGVGKSTLAREIYRHRRITAAFDFSGWVSVSQQFQPKQVFLNLLYSLVPRTAQILRRKMYDDVKTKGATEALRDFLTENKCLVVLDDVWNERAWQSLKDAFLPIVTGQHTQVQAEDPDRASTSTNTSTPLSRIILTTRNQETIKSLGGNLVHTHVLQNLDASKSWDLFVQTAFQNGKSTDSEKLTLGKRMIERCNGVPLAIVVLANALKDKENVADWSHMRNDIQAQIQRGDAPNVAYREVFDVLRVSYDELPFHLKQCFLYLAKFPEDYEIPVDKLYPLWFGEGMIVKDDPFEKDEIVGERYLNELVGRNMVQADKRGLGSGKIITCRLHDLTRDMCIDIANKEGFFKLVNCDGRALLDSRKPRHLLMTSLPQRDKRIRRLAVYVSAVDQDVVERQTTSSVSRAPNLRSLLLFSINGVQDKNKFQRMVETITSDFPLLRVFSCDNLHIRGKGVKLPKKVGKLIHLRYLSLFNTRVFKLPSSIGKLEWLQTLDLRVDPNIVLTIPNILWKMKQLRHLYLPLQGGLLLADQQTTDGKYRIQKKYRIQGGEALQLDGLGNLQTILHLDLDNLNIWGLDLENMNTIVVALTCKTKTGALYPFLQSSRSIALRLHACILNHEPEIISKCKVIHKLDIHARPYANCRLSLQRPPPCSLDLLPISLIDLGIWYVQLQEDPMPVLEKLPNLVNLGLRMCYDRDKMVCSAGGFPKLQYLCFDGLGNFKHWKVANGALQKLRAVLIINCPLENDPREKFPSLDEDGYRVV